MSEKKSHTSDNELIVKYLSGSASSAEIQELELWVKAGSANKAEFLAAKKAWFLAGAADDAAQIDVNSEWKKMAGELKGQAKIAQLPRHAKRSNRRQWLSIAAGFAILAIAGFWLLKGTGNSTQSFVADATMLEQKLSDGSQITLNQFASITFDPKLDGKYRQVELKGDAFFDVQRDEQHPFRIQTSDIQIEVLGTSFYVDARAEQSTVQVIVRSGSVAVESGADKVVLTAGEVANYDKQTKQLTKKGNENVNYLAWKTKVFTFENTTLKEVVATLNASYDTSITLDNEDLGNCRLTATYTNKSLDAVIRIIESSMGISSEKNGKNILLKGEGC